jgi:hypothetical protein
MTDKLKNSWRNCFRRMYACGSCRDQTSVYLWVDACRLFSTFPIISFCCEDRSSKVFPINAGSVEIVCAHWLCCEGVHDRILSRNICLLQLRTSVSFTSLIFLHCSHLFLYWIVFYEMKAKNQFTYMHLDAYSSNIWLSVSNLPICFSVETWKATDLTKGVCRGLQGCSKHKRR